MQSVISNLLISHIELRSEDSPDIRAHSHQRNVEKVVVPLGEALSAYQTHYLQVGTAKDCHVFVSALIRTVFILFKNVILQGIKNVSSFILCKTHKLLIVSTTNMH